MASSITPDVDNSHFNDPTLSDLSIILSARTIAVHRVILCRSSKYFHKPILGRFRENGANEVELQEDEPEAMMAMFRFMCNLPYKGSCERWREKESLVLLHAQVYMAADEYQVAQAKQAAYEEMGLMLSCGFLPLDVSPAVRTIFKGTLSSGRGIRPPMLEYCVCHLAKLRKQAAFMVLFKEITELGAAIIGHESLDLGPRYDRKRKM